ncbi:MAG: DUF5715 family protein [Pyrinomonadaceae bacterium]
MKKATLHIETRDQQKTVSVEDEVSIGRTDAATVALDDVGLSRVNTTFFRDGDLLLVVDEDSLNGTFLNGEKVGNRPTRVLDGDIVKLGLETFIRVEIESQATAPDTGKKSNAVPDEKPDGKTKSPKAKPKPPAPQPQGVPMFVKLAVVSSFLIVLLAGFTILLIKLNQEPGGNGGGGTTTGQTSNSDIPVRVIDPLGGGDADDWDDILAYWDVKEDDINLADVDAITADTGERENKVNLKVSLKFYQEQLDRANQARPNSGIRPPGMIVPPELRNGIGAQVQKIQEMKRNNYKLPLDFADLAEKRLNRKLIELPMATDNFVLDVGGSSKGTPFTDFEYNRSPQSVPIQPGSPDYQILSQLAANFDGQKYDLNNDRDRQQMKIRLLRMFHPSARPILATLAKNYREKYKLPLRVTSLSRSMEYQIGLNKGNSNSYVVRNANAVPPHTSGCTFDLSRRYMSAEEQNYLMTELAKLEQQKIVDALIEYGGNPCFHVFILAGCDV